VNPVLYDFKRGVLRASVLIAVALFTLAGVSIAYAVLTIQATTLGYREPAVCSYVDDSTGEFKLEVLLLSPEIRPVDGEVYYELISYKASPKGLEQKTLDQGVHRSSGGRVTVAKSLGEAFGEEASRGLRVRTATAYGSRRSGCSIAHSRWTTGRFTS
jgi:hypothetical protein